MNGAYSFIQLSEQVISDATVASVVLTNGLLKTYGCKGQASLFSGLATTHEQQTNGEEHQVFSTFVGAIL